ncbi:Glycerate dehydrogenase HPR, peroxisomal [Apostasia shenzhenica]|uniref:Glycerate dehydrogenase HPR, peroxisomal n=1 Tax=Apostasia shenzhenica TaxID=1088818 RepID=A0A2I0BCS8_9ASPA|nr:Glycerate dehydrogenase HPR, peroxisomal [Apostasia shenzhenica]
MMTELAALLLLVIARRIVEADQSMKAGLYEAWLSHLFLKNAFYLLHATEWYGEWLVKFMDTIVELKVITD